MRVEKGLIVTIIYKVMDGDNLVEEAKKEAPVNYLHGTGMLMPALEVNIEGMEISENKKFRLPPRQTYGDRDETNVVTLPQTLFPADVDLSDGSRLAARTMGGDTYPLTVVKVSDGRVVVDLNHPLAGKYLDFDITVLDVRLSGVGEMFSGLPEKVEVV